MYQSKLTFGGEASTTRPVGSETTRTNSESQRIVPTSWMHYPPLSNQEYNAIRSRLLNGPNHSPAPGLHDIPGLGSVPQSFDMNNRPLPDLLDDVPHYRRFPGPPGFDVLGPMNAPDPSALVVPSGTIPHDLPHVPQMSPSSFPRNQTRSSPSSKPCKKKKRKTRAEFLQEEKHVHRDRLRQMERDDKVSRQHSQMLPGLSRLFASRIVPEEFGPLSEEDVANSSSPPPSGTPSDTGSILGNARAALKTASELPTMFESFKTWFSEQKDVILTDMDVMKDSAFKSLDSTLGGFASALTKGGATLIALGTFIFSAIKCCHDYSKAYAITATLSFCFLGYVTGTFQYIVDKVSSLVTYFKSWKKSKQRSQSGFDTIGKLIATVLSYWSVRAAPDAKKISEVSKALAGWDRCARGSAELLTFVMDSVRPLIEKVREWCGYDAIVAELLGVQKVDAWIQRCTVALNQFNESKVRTVETLRLFRGLANEGYALMTGRYARDEQAHVHAVCRAWIARLDKCVSICEAAGLEAGPRQVPLCIYISGPSGVGKSAAILYIAVRLLLHINRNSKVALEAIKKDYMSFLHSRESWNEFWDGINIFCQGIIWNDPAQNPDPTQDPFYMELLKVIDLWPLHVHMSAIEDKGNTFIAPKFVIIATNEDVPPANALKHSEALNRRFHIRVKAHVNPEFAHKDKNVAQLWDLRLDPETLKPYADPTGGIPFVKGVTGFTPMGISGEITESVSYDLDQLIALCCQRYDKLERDYNSYMKSNNVEFERLINEMLNPTPYVPATPSYQPTLDPTVAEQKGKQHADVQPDLQPEVPKQTSQMKPVLTNLSEKLAAPTPARHRFVRTELGDVSIGKDDLDNPIWGITEPHFGVPITPGSAESAAAVLAGKPPLPEFPSYCVDPYAVNNPHIEVVKSWKLSDHWTDIAKLNKAENAVDRPDIATRALFFAVLTAHPRWKSSVALAVAAQLQRWYDDAVIHGEVSKFLEQVSHSDLTPLLANVDVWIPTDITRWWLSYTKTLRSWIAAFIRSDWFQGLTLVFQATAHVAIVYLCIWAVVKVFNKFFGKKKGKSQSDAKTPQKSPQTQKVPAKPQESQSDPKMPQKHTRVIARVPQTSQIGGDNTVEAIAERVLKSNVYIIKTPDGQKLISFTVFKDHVCWINTHFIAQIKSLVLEKVLSETDTIQATHVLTGNVYDLFVADLLDSVPIGNDHNTFYWNNRLVPLAKNLVPYVLSEEDHRRYASGICHMLLQVPQHHEGVTTIRTQVVEARRVENVVVEDDNGEYTVPAAYHYSCQTVAGDCGSIIYIINKNSRAWKIGGSHTSGGVDNGSAGILTREMLEKALSYFPDQIDSPAEVVEAAKLELFEGNPVIKEVPKEQQPSLANKSSLIPTPYQHCQRAPVAPQKRPSRLMPFTNEAGERVHPYMNALHKYVPQYLPLANFDDIRPCVEAEAAHIWNSWDDTCRREPLALLSYEVAVAGDGEGRYAGIPRNTSAGWPLCLEAIFPSTGKKKWLGSGEYYDFDSAEAKKLRARVMELIAKAREGKQSFNVCLDVLKDELVSMEKWINGATRFISATDLAFLIAMRIYFGAFADFMHRTRIHNSCTVGVNAYGPEWDAMVKKLHEISKTHLYDGDFKGLDSTTNPLIHWEILERLIIPMYGLPSDHPDNVARRVLWADIVGSKHIFRDIIYQWLFSHPSGHFLTTLLNSIYIRVAARKAFINLSPNGINDLLAFDDVIRMLTHGDDHLIAVAKHVASWYKPTALAAEFEKLGLHYTSAKKEKVTDEWKTVEQTLFLKRQTRFEPRLNRYVGALIPASIHELPHWTHKSDSASWEDAKERFAIASRELSLHEPSFFEAVHPLMCEAYEAAYHMKFPITDRWTLMRQLISTDWEIHIRNGLGVGKFRPNTQESIGMLGSGASKGDGVEPMEIVALDDNDYPHDECPSMMLVIIYMKDVSPNPSYQCWKELWHGTRIDNNGLARKSKPNPVQYLFDLGHGNAYCSLDRPIPQHPWSPEDKLISFYCDECLFHDVCIEFANMLFEGPVHEYVSNVHSRFTVNFIAQANKAMSDLLRWPTDEYFNAHQFRVLPFDPEGQEEFEMWLQGHEACRDVPHDLAGENLDAPCHENCVEPRDEQILDWQWTRFQNNWPNALGPWLWHNRCPWISTYYCDDVCPRRIDILCRRSSHVLYIVYNKSSFTYEGATAWYAMGLQISQSYVHVTMPVRGVKRKCGEAGYDLTHMSTDPEVFQLYSSAPEAGNPRQLKQIRTLYDVISVLHRRHPHDTATSTSTTSAIIENGAAPAPDANVQQTLAPRIDMAGTDLIRSDRPGEKAEIELPLPPPAELIKTNTTQFVPDLDNVFSSWVSVNAGTIDTTVTAGTVITTFNPLTSFLSNAAITAKVQGFQGARLDLEVEIMVNANEMQQGVFRLVWVPMGDMSGIMTTTRIADLVLNTQLPGVNLDLATQSSARLVLPFVFPAAFHSFLTGRPSFGTCALVCYSPLKTGSGGSTTFGYTLMVRAVPGTMRLFNPTNMTAPLLAGALPPRVWPSMPKQQSQSKKGHPAKGKKKDISETEASQSGPISKWLGNMEGIALAASAIPVLTEFAAPAAWGLAWAKNVAQTFGFGHFRDENPTIRQHLTLDPTVNTVDGGALVGTLAATQTAKLEVMPGFAGSNVDEMSFDYILQKACFLATFNWAGSGTTGSLLFSLGANPTNLAITRTGPPNYIVSGPLCYISRFFGKYHGSLKYIFRLVKTRLHSGKLLLAWYPGRTSDPGFANSIYAHREWIDISAGNEFSFIVPFNTHSSYLEVNSTQGILCVYIQNELTSVSTIANNIDVLVEVCAAPGWEFADLKPMNFGPVIPAGVTPKQTSQALKGGVPAKAITEDAAVAGAKVVSQDIDLARVICGERIRSVKQMMMMGSPIFNSLGYTSASYFMRPFTIGFSDSNAGAWRNNDFGRDFISCLAGMYLFSTGGVILRFFNPQTATAVGTSKWRIDYNDTGIVQAIDTAHTDTDANYRWLYNSMSGLTGAYVPPYQQNWARLNRITAMRGSSGIFEPQDEWSSNALVMYQQVNGTYASVAEMSRSAADDYLCGFFLGVPPYAPINTNTQLRDNPPPVPSTGRSVLTSSFAVIETDDDHPGMGEVRPPRFSQNALSIKSGDLPGYTAGSGDV